MKISCSRLPTALAVLLGLSGIQAQAIMQSLPFSAQDSYFLFKLASSLHLSDVQTSQCDTFRAELSQGSSVAVSHSFVLPENSQTARATLNEYAQTQRFTPLQDWNMSSSGRLSRQFTDPGVQGYRYAVNLAPIGGDSTALCVSMLGVAQ